MPENAPYESAPGADRRPEASPSRSLFRIGEVGRLTGTKPFVLRYWETEFPTLQPVKSPKGHRLYRREDVETVRQIKHLLYDEGFTIAGARRHLAETTAPADASHNTLRKPPAAVPAPVAGRTPGLFPEDDVLEEEDRGDNVAVDDIHDDIHDDVGEGDDNGRETVVRSLNHDIRENDARQNVARPPAASENRVRETAARENSIEEKHGPAETGPHPNAAHRGTSPDNRPDSQTDNRTDSRDHRSVPDVRETPDAPDDWDAAHTVSAPDGRERAPVAHEPKRAQQLSGGRLRVDSTKQVQIDRQALVDLRDALRSLLTLLES